MIVANGYTPYVLDIGIWDGIRGGDCEGGRGFGGDGYSAGEIHWISDVYNEIIIMSDDPLFFVCMENSFHTGESRT